MTQIKYQFEVGIEEEGRVDKFLSDRLLEISRSKVKNFIESGAVTLNGMVVDKAGEKAKPGDVITILVTEDDSDGLVPEEIPLNIIYEDQNVIVINKEAGQVVHPGAGNYFGTLVNALLAYYPPIRDVGEKERPGVVHRLDKDTSGAVIFAKTDKAYKWLVTQFKKRNTQKAYLALVDGKPPTPTGRIEAPIVRDRKDRTRMAVGLQGQGKKAVSEYFTIEEFQKHTYLEVHPITGRTHQIRIHLSYLDVPVVGDRIYGRRHPSIEMDRFFLHAKSLSIKLPGDRVPRTFNADLPEDLQKILEWLRRNERRLG
jgi:23S rRNA pseudouridine1911/1915/1917 synthase